MSGRDSFPTRPAPKRLHSEGKAVDMSVRKPAAHGGHH